MADYGEDWLQRIVGVHWRDRASAVYADVIVVFVANSGLESQPDAAYTPLGSNTQFLQSWRTPYQQAGFQPGFPSRAYHVQSNAAFMQVTAPDTFADGADYGSWTTVLVFAIDNLNLEGSPDKDAIARSLGRAIAGTQQVIPAIYMINHTGSSDIPAEMAPPGLLWLVESGPVNGGTSLTWIMRFGPHRDDDELEPPNNMVQCYSSGPPYGFVSGGEPITWSGYFIYAYRLDINGTSAVYGKQLSADGDSQQNIDPAWSQPIESSFSGIHGIPFQDPPPMISRDLV